MWLQTTGEKNGPFAPIPFGIISVNKGNVWNQTANAASISVSGFYYLHVQLASCYTAGAKFDININGKIDFSVQFLTHDGIAGTARNQAVIRKLKTGDTITVSITTANTCLYGGMSDYSKVAFYGFYWGPQ